MLNVKIGNAAEQILSASRVIRVESGDKIEVSVGEGGSYQVLISDNQADVILQVTNADGSTYDVVLDGLASLYQSGDIVTQLNLDIDGETMVVGSVTELFEALDATAAGGVDGQNRSFVDDNANIDPNRSAAEDSDHLRSDAEFTPLEEYEGAPDSNEQPVVGDVFIAQNEIQGIEAAGDLNIITGQLTATDANIGDTHTFTIVDGTLSVTDTNGVITIIEDSIEVTVNPDGTYSVSGDFNDLSDGEVATVTFNYTATDGSGLTSVPATVSFTVTGTNDIPVVEAINVNGSETYDNEDILGSDDTQDESTNFFTGLLSVSDDDVSNEGLHTYHIVQDEGGDNIVSVDAPAEITNITVATVQNIDGTWNYTIDGDFSALAAGEIATVTFQYYADDTRGFDGTDGIHESSISVPKTITLAIVGTNDQPVVSNVINSATEGNGIEVFDGKLYLTSDEDLNDTHTFAQSGTASVVAGTTIGDFGVVVDLDGAYHVTGNFDALAQDEEATVTFQYTATDSSIGSEENNTSEIKSVILTITGTNDTPIIGFDQSYTVNETLSDVGTVIASDVDSSNLTYSLLEDSIFQINSTTGEISIKDGATLDFESGSNYTLDVKVTDEYGASDTKSVEVNVNDITGKVTYTIDSLVDYTFDFKNNEGWEDGHLPQSQQDHQHDVFGKFGEDTTINRVFDLGDDYVNKEVTVEFDINVSPVFGHWNGEDGMSVTIVANDVEEILYPEYSPGNSEDTYHIVMQVLVDDEGKLDINFDSETIHPSETWSLDNFQIISQDQILTFDTDSQGEIDMAVLLNQSNDFEDSAENPVSNPDTLDEIDLSSGEHILSNLSVEDFVAMTDDDNTLQIIADANDGDRIELASSEWKVANGTDSTGDPDSGVDQIAGDGFITYTDAATASMQLLIDDNIDDVLV
ncbi:MAG: VCBS domain-containing protein [Campylobacterota bacterium]|nr:VCBS domain-containing protein [Campylobacterota bacterium]